jgi:acyl-CoA thioester hydrolase
MPNFHFIHPIEVRYGDLDPQGHLNNSRYLTFFETARIQYFVRLGLFHPEQSFMEIGIILADAHVIFKAPIEYGQDVSVCMRIAKIGNKSMHSEYAIIDNQTGAELAAGSSVLVGYDYQKAITIPIPESWRTIISAFEDLNV